MLGLRPNVLTTSNQQLASLPPPGLPLQDEQHVAEYERELCSYDRPAAGQIADHRRAEREIDDQHSQDRKMHRERHRCCLS